MFRSSKRISDLETRVAALALAVAELRQAREASTPEAMLSLIQQIQTDLELTRASLRSAHGKLDIQKRLGAEKNGSAGNIASDEEFQAMLDLQNQFTGGGRSN